MRTGTKNALLLFSAGYTIGRTCCLPSGMRFGILFLQRRRRETKQLPRERESACPSLHGVKNCWVVGAADREQQLEEEEENAGRTDSRHGLTLVSHTHDRAIGKCVRTKLLSYSLSECILECARQTRSIAATKSSRVANWVKRSNRANWPKQKPATGAITLRD